MGAVSLQEMATMGSWSVGARIGLWQVDLCKWAVGQERILVAACDEEEFAG